MTRRATALKLAAFALAASLITPATLQAQTKPKITVPPETRSQAHGIVQQLLREGKIIRASEVKRGMRGVARSVFQGTKIEEFPIEVLGVLSRVQGGGDLVLIRVLSGPVVKRNTGIIAGMSGSPVYINGKMLGAIAIGWGFPKEPIGGVTPITQMIETSLPDPSRGVARPAPARSAPSAAPKQAPGKAKSYRTGQLNEPTLGTYYPKGDLQIAGHKIGRVHVSRDMKRLALAEAPGGATMNMRPVSTLLQLSGFSESALPALRKAYAKYGIEPVIGPASRKIGPNPPFLPGSAIGVQMVSGDMDQTAVGTVTFRWGNRILAFGHPMFGQGSTSLPMTTSFIHDIFPSYERSFKLASPINVIGALQQDTEFAIGGTIGAVADTIPVSIGLTDPERQIKKTYHVRVMKDPVLTPTLLGIVATEAINTTLGQASDKMVRVGLRMQIDGAPTLVKRNYLYAPGDISEAALADLGQSIGITQMNEFARGSIRRVDLTVALEPVRRTARIKSLFADRNKVKAGENVRVSVVMEPDGSPGKTFTKTFSFAVPADAPSGSMRIAAAPSSAYYPLRIRVGAPPPEPTNLKELIEAYSNLGPSNELMVDASTPDTFLMVDRKKVANPSPTWSKLLRNSASTAIGTFNEVVSTKVLTTYSLYGAQVITIPVESLKDRDKLTVTTDAAAAAKPDVAIIAASADDKPPVPVAGDDGDGADNGEMAFPARRMEKLIENPTFLTQLKTWQRMADTIPGREQPVRPVTPTVTSPKPTPTPSGTPTPTPSPTPVVLPVDGGKGVGRPALSWVQASPTDFLRGTFERAQVSSEGAIRLSPPTQLLATTAEAFAWSIAGDSNGNVYLGTGNKARVLKINVKGEVSTLYDGDEVAVTALTTDSAGNVYAGVSPGGRVYSFSPSGQRSLVFDSHQTFVMALEWDANGNLLVGTGDAKGKLFRINRGSGDAHANGAALYASGAAPLATFEQKQVRAIAVRGSEIYVATGGDGVLYSVDPASGAATALYEAGNESVAPVTPAVAGAQPATEITAVVAAPEGIYFGTLNSGTIYRYTDGVGIVALYPSPQQSIYALKRTADGRLFAASGDKGIVYQITPADNPGNVRGARILEPTQLQATTLAVSPAGDLLVGTANNAAAYRVSLNASAPEAKSGTFTSAVLDAKNTVRWGAVRVIGNAALETRTGNTADPDSTWSAWQSADRNDLGELRIASPSARYLQYRARLTAAASGEAEPSLQRVEIVYRAKNLPPTVGFTSPHGGEFWNAKKKLTWAGADPNSDTLNYKLSVSNDDGKTWQKVTLTDDSMANFELDTTKYADGVYRAKVEATDAIRNPDDPQTDQDTSAPFIIDNKVPDLDTPAIVKLPDGSVTLRVTATDALSPVVSASWRVTPVKPVAPAVAAVPAVTPTKTDKPNAKAKKADAKSKTPAATATATATAKEATVKETTVKETGAVTTVAVEVKPEVKAEDADKWTAAITDDGLFDSRREAIIVTIPADAVTAGKGRTVELRIRDAAENVAILTINMP